MKFKVFLLVISVGFFSACSDSSAVDLKEGNWVLEMRSEMAGMQMQMPAIKSEQCITKKEMIPMQQSEDESGCKVTDKKISGSTVTWAVVCPESKGKGSMTYKGTTFEGRVDIELIGERTMKMTTFMKGKYIGPCNK